jgi:hypothetical protein
MKRAVSPAMSRYLKLEREAHAVASLAARGHVDSASVSAAWDKANKAFEKVKAERKRR